MRVVTELTDGTSQVRSTWASPATAPVMVGCPGAKSMKARIGRTRSVVFFVSGAVSAAKLAHASVSFSCADDQYVLFSNAPHRCR